MDSGLLAEIALLAIPVIVAITFHEAAHGYVALHFGDQTAKNAGRVTLNPLRHIDLFGTIILPIILIMSTGFMFGYAKPVPVNFSALRNPRWDMVWVAAAGPGMNILLAVVSAFLLHVYLATGVSTEPFLANLFVRSVELNVLLAVFNLIPLPPLDGSKVVAPFLPAALARTYLNFGRFGMLILVVLLVFAPSIPIGGNHFDIFDVLVRRPADELTKLIMFLTGGGG